MYIDGTFEIKRRHEDDESMSEEIEEDEEKNMSVGESNETSNDGY